MLPRIASMPSVTSSTLGRVSAGYHVVGDQHALAAQPERRRELAPQLGVLDLLAHVRAGDLLGAAHDLRVLDEAQQEALAAPVDAAAHGLLQERQRPVQAALDARRRPVGVRQDPRRGALEDVHLADAVGDLRHELDRRGAGADDRDALAGEVVVVVPLGGVEHRALEAAHAPDPRHRRVAQRAGRVDRAAAPSTRRARSRRSSARARRPTPRRSARGRSGCAGAGRARRRRRAGTARSPAGASTCASSRGSARTRTSTGARGRRTGSPGTCWPATCRRRRRRAR